MPLQKRRDEFFKVMVHTLYRTAVYNGCKKSVRMKLKIHRASNEESDVLSVYKRQQWGYRPKLSAKWILSILSDFTSHQRNWEFTFQFLSDKIYSYTKKKHTIWYLAIWQNCCFGLLWTANLWITKLMLKQKATKMPF